MNTNDLARIIASIPQLSEEDTQGETGANIYIKSKNGQQEWVSGAKFEASYGADGSVVGYTITLEGTGGM